MKSLNRIVAKGFKSIREMDLELGELNVLIGANGAGKTNFISVFKLLNEVVEGRLQVFVGQAGGADALLYFGQEETSEIFVHLDFEPNSYEATLILSRSDTLIFAEERCFFHDVDRYHKPYEVFLGSGHKETELPQEARERGGRIAGYVLGALKSWQVYHFHNTSESAKVKKTGDVDDNSVLRPDASNLAAFLYLLQEKHTDHYDRITKTIRLVAPFFDDFVLRPSPLNPNKIQLEWRERDSDAYFNAHTFSDGTLRFICLTTLLLQPELPSILLIDEPELGLHPYAITLLASMLKSAATRTQVIVSTQSVSLVNQFSPEEIIVVDRKDGQSVFEHLMAEEIESWLDEYGLGDLWEKNILGGRPQ